MVAAQWDNELYIVFGNRRLKALQDACSRDHSLNSRRLHCFEEAGVQPIRIHKLPMGEVSNKSSEFAPNLANFTPQGVSKRNGTCNLEDGLLPDWGHGPRSQGGECRGRRVPTHRKDA